MSASDNGGNLPEKRQIDLLPLREGGMPWERLDGETLKAYSNFCVYRNMGSPGVGRSIRQSARELELHEDTLFEQSVKYRWVERADLYDEYLERRWREDRESAQMRAINEATTVGRSLVAVGARRLRGDNREGQEVNAIDPNELTPMETAKFIESGARLMLSGTGTPLDAVKQAMAGTAGEWIRVLKGQYDILMRYVPEERQGRAQAELQAFYEGGGGAA